MGNELIRRGLFNPRRSFFSFGPLWDDFLAGATTDGGERQLRPAIDVSENENAVTVTAELPGLAKDDVQVTIEDGVLAISGEKKTSTEKKDDSYHLVERRYGSFHRSLTLPSGVEAEKADASFENGVLKISIPKQEQVKPRKLQIK